MTSPTYLPPGGGGSHDMADGPSSHATYEEGLDEEEERGPVLDACADIAGKVFQPELNGDEEHNDNKEEEGEDNSATPIEPSAAMMQGQNVVDKSCEDLIFNINDDILRDGLK